MTTSIDHLDVRDADRRCPDCGWPEATPYEFVSRHWTSTGAVVYTRCACGALQVRRFDAGGERLLRRGRSTQRSGD